MNRREFKLLIVDDEEDISFSTQSYFKKRGFTVRVTPSGSECLDLTKSYTPDVIILDLAIRDTSGIDVLKKIRESDSKLRVIIVTGQIIKRKIIQEIAALGVGDFINKPVVLSELEEVIFSVLQNNVHKKAEDFKRCLVKQDKPEIETTTHALANLLGIIRTKCENFVSNYEEGFYSKKSSDELLRNALKIMKEIQATVDQTMEVIQSDLEE